MARLDRLIQVLHEQRADALQLAVGKPAALVTNGATRAITKDPLTDGQIVGLVREIAGVRRRRAWAAVAPVAFGYHVAQRRGPGGGHARRGPRGRCDRRGAAAPEQPRDAAAAPRGPIWPRRAGQMEGLLRLLVESGASDLHLRSGEPPLLRRQGELAREQSEPISAGAAGDPAAPAS